MRSRYWYIDQGCNAATVFVVDSLPAQREATVFRVAFPRINRLMLLERPLNPVAWICAEYHKLSGGVQ